MKIRG